MSMLSGTALIDAHPDADRSRTWLCACARSWACLLIVGFSTWLAARYIFWTGFEGSDDMFYVRFAALWHRVPANHWEARLLGNVIIGAAIRLFGYSEWAAALPSLLASLTVLGSVLFVCRRFASIRCAWWAGLLAAIAPVEVNNASTISAHAIMVGLLAAGTAGLVCAAESRRACWVASICLPLGLIAHYNSAYYIAALLVAGMVVDHRRFLRPVIQIALGCICALAAEMAVFHFAYGDALCGMRAATPDRLGPGNILTGLTVEMVGWSILQTVFGKTFGLALIVTWTACLLCYRRLSTPVRILLVGSMVFWTILNFGTYVPWAYRPFWRNTRYWHPLVLPTAVCFGWAMTEVSARQWMARLGVISLGSCLLMLSLNGSWGQSIRISRELLAYVLAHPEQRFVADVNTLNEIYTLNALKTPSNLCGTTSDGLTHFLDRSVPRHDDLRAAGCTAILVNPLNTARNPSFAAWSQTHTGPVQLQTNPAHRPICTMLPFLKAYHWTLRRPVASIHTVK